MGEGELKDVGTYETGGAGEDDFHDGDAWDQ